MNEREALEQFRESLNSQAPNIYFLLGCLVMVVGAAVDHYRKPEGGYWVKLVPELTIFWLLYLGIAVLRWFKH